MDWIDEFKDLTPEQQEQKKQELLEEYFASLEPERAEKARRMQWRIDQDLKHFKNPQARADRAFSKMINFILYGDPPPPEQEATVLEFKHK